MGNRPFIDPAKIRRLLAYERETGTFRWNVNKSSNARKGQLAGCNKEDGRRIIRIDGRLEFGNRLAWVYVTGQQPVGVIDHIDGDPSNDSFSNLRDVSHSENLQNQKRPRSDNKLNALGVSWDKGRKKFRAQINVNGENRFLGRFITIDLAKEAYMKAKAEMHIGDPS